MRVEVNRVFNSVARNLGINDYTQNIDSWAEWAFEAEQYIGGLKTFQEREITYATSTDVATAEIEHSSSPAEKSWIEINGTRFYYRDTTAANFVDNDDYVIDTSITGPIDALDGSGSVVYLDQLSRDMAQTCRKINSSYYENLRGIKASPVASATVSSGVIELEYQRSGDEGNHNTLMTSGGAKITKFFSGGKERIHNKQIRLPNNFIKMLSIRAADTIISPTSSQFKSKVSDQLNRYYVDGNRVNFSKDYIDDIVVTYLAMPLSEEGYPTIKQGHEEAVASYIMWKHKLIDYYNGKLAQYIIKDLEKSWNWLCGQTRGNDNMPNSVELLKIGKMWNTKVPVTSANPPLYDGLNSY